VTSRSDLLTNLLAAVSIGVLQIGVSVSLAAFIFSGQLADGAGRAAASFVLGTALASLVVGGTSKMSVVISGSQGTSAILVAAVATSLIASPDMAEGQAVPTVVMLIVISALLTGAAFTLIGHYGLTSFVRFLPFPVVSGFIVGTGWLLFRGGVAVMTSREVSLFEIFDLAQWSSIKFMLPGLGFAALMLLIISIERLPNTLVSVLILGGALLFHVVGRAFTSLDQLETDGWLIGPFAAGTDWSPVGPTDFANTNWDLLLDNGPGIVTIVVVSLIVLLLNLSSLEGETDPHIDLNSEIRAAGIANLLIGLGGGLIGYHVMSNTLLARRIGARGRIVPLTMAALAVVAFLLGPDLIALVPRAIAGGVLAGLGLSLMITWLSDALPQMNRTDSILSGVILLSIAAFGVLTGVLIGIVIAAAVFTFNYSRTNPVRHTMKAAGRSTIGRDDHDATVLARNADAIVAFELQGFLFFGSATGARRQVEAHITPGTTDYVILDFSRVTGIDSTAVGALTTLADQLEAQHIVTVWSGADADVSAELHRSGEKRPSHHVDLDHAIAWCENDLLAAVDEWTSGTGRFRNARTGLPFDDDVLAVLDLPQFSLVPGQVLIAAGNTDNDLYFIEQGTLTAWIENADGKQVRIRQVVPGAILGEVAFSTGAPRKATVIVDTPATVRLLRRADFDQLAKASPQAAIAIQQELLQRMGQRIIGNAATVRDLLR